MLEHRIIYQKNGRFGGWPANHGAWNWGDEILVAFREGAFHENRPDDHAIAWDEDQRVLLGRSLDGGNTWTVTDPSFKRISPHSFDVKVRTDDILPCPGGIDFSNPDFCATFTLSTHSAQAVSWWYWSGDRGQTWHGPYEIPTMGFPNVMARTDYLVLNANELLMFLTVGRPNYSGTEGRVICAKLCEGGKRFELVGLVGDEPARWSIMPSTAMRKNGDLVCLVRHLGENPDAPKNDAEEFCFIHQYESKDCGKSWIKVGTVAERVGSTPAALVAMKNGAWAFSFARRLPPYGMLVRFSDDEGRSWGEVQTLRSDGGNFDLGYPRMVENAKGQLVSMYYYNQDEHKERYIAATVFDRKL